MCPVLAEQGSQRTRRVLPIKASHNLEKVPLWCGGGACNHQPMRQHWVGSSSLGNDYS